MPKVPVNTTMDIDLLDAIDAAAKADGLNRSEWLRDAAKAKLQWRKLTEAEREKIMPEAAPVD